MPIKITIEPTDEMALTDAGPCRVWRGTTESGSKVLVLAKYVGLAESATPADKETFERELIPTDQYVNPMQILFGDDHG